ncbi:MAG: TPM domain-containing protein [Bacteroidota bacterium]
MVKFFSPEEEATIVAAIQQAELATSGEIRVHVEVGAEAPALAVAQRVFFQLGMDKTKDRNGVLILLEVDRREFAIIGDEGINKVVPEDFWDTERDLLQQYFRRGEFAPGIVLAIEQVGVKLKEFFPYAADDVNELPDSISYGK